MSGTLKRRKTESVSRNVCALMETELCKWPCHQTGTSLIRDASGYKHYIMQNQAGTAARDPATEHSYCQ